LNFPAEPEPPAREQLEWPDGQIIELPNEPGLRAARWASRLYTLDFHDRDLVARYLQAMIDEERQNTLVELEREIIKRF